MSEHKRPRSAARRPPAARALAPGSARNGPGAAQQPERGPPAIPTVVVSGVDGGIRKHTVGARALFFPTFGANRKARRPIKMIKLFTFELN